MASNWGYVEIYMNEYHPRKRPNGCVLEHILIAEIMLGRFLLPKEVVHHKDRNRQNNVPENLMVFVDNANHQRFHQTGIAIETNNGSYISPEKKAFCKKCGKEIWVETKSMLCRECVSVQSRKVERPTKHELQEMISTYPFTTLAKMFGVSDNAIRKWCKSYDLIYKKNNMGV